MGRLVPLRTLRRGRHGVGDVSGADGPHRVCGEPQPEAQGHRRQGRRHVGGQHYVGLPGDLNCFDNYDNM
jgi:hypothetical protein